MDVLGDSSSTSSSVRTHLMKAQILDGELEASASATASAVGGGGGGGVGGVGDDDAGLLAELLADDKENQIDGAAVLSEMDDAIVRLRKWQLDREITRLEMEAELQHALDLKAARTAASSSSSSSSASSSASALNHDDDGDGGSGRAAAASQRALVAVEALLQAQITGPDRRIDLSVLAQQDRALATEADRTLAEGERVEAEIRDAVCRRRCEEVMYAGTGLEADVSSLTAQLRHYSDDLDDLLARAGDGGGACVDAEESLPIPPAHFK